MGHHEEKPATRRQAAQLRAFLPEADISRGFQETVVSHTLTEDGIGTNIVVPQSLSHCVVADGTYLWDIDVRVDVMGALARLSGDDQLVLAVNADPVPGRRLDNPYNTEQLRQSTEHRRDALTRPGQVRPHVGRLRVLLNRITGR
jgi:hypothetical protein